MLDSQKYDYISADIETRILISEFCSAKQLTLHIIDPYKPYNCVALTSDRVVWKRLVASCDYMAAASWSPGFGASAGGN